MPEGVPITKANLITDIIDQSDLITDKSIRAQALLTAAQNWPHTEQSPDRANLDFLLGACLSACLQTGEPATPTTLNIMSQMARLVE